MYFTKHFKQYLLSRFFYLRSDNSALQWLRRTPEPLGQNARWLQQLEEFSFHLSHRKGTSHANADALSRHSCLSKPSCTACHPELEQQKPSARGAHLVTSSEAESSAGRGSNGLESAGSGGTDRQHHPADRRQSPSVAPADGVNSTDNAAGDTPNPAVLTVPRHMNTDSSIPDIQMCGWDRDSLIASQRTDPDIKIIVSLLEQSAEKPAWKDVELQSADVKSLYTEWQRLAFRNGLLCRQWTELTGNIVWQIILPRQYRAEFVKVVHTGMTGGHLGQHKTEEHVRQRAY